MKRKLFTIFTLASLATSGFAMEIVKGKLISHKESTSNNHIKLLLQETNKKENISFFKKMNIETPINDEISTLNDMRKATGIVNYPVDILADTGVMIENHTSQSHTYTIHRNICASITSWDWQPYCGLAVDEINLEPQGFVSLGNLEILSMTFDKPGYYPTAVRTLVSREDKATLFTSYGVGYVDITDVKKSI